MDLDALWLNSGRLPDSWLNLLQRLPLKIGNVKTTASKSSPIKKSTYWFLAVRVLLWKFLFECHALRDFWTKPNEGNPMLTTHWLYRKSQCNWPMKEWPPGGKYQTKGLILFSNIQVHSLIFNDVWQWGFGNRKQALVINARLGE